LHSRCLRWVAWRFLANFLSPIVIFVACLAVLRIFSIVASTMSAGTESFSEMGIFCVGASINAFASVRSAFCCSSAAV
jgi:hypothetical protein